MSLAATDASAHRSREGQEFTLRPASGLGDLDRCILLQQQTWGYSDLEVVPRNMYVLAQALGGHVLCAWDAREQFAGFAMAMAAHEPSPAGRPPLPYLHSHQLAIAPEYRRRGLGAALKFAQRERALAAGIRRMRWTFDPLMALNAAFNLNRLGATVRRYVPDFYGRLSSSLQGGTPTDRFVAEWELDGERVEAARDGRLAPPRSAENIPLPPEIAAWRASGDVNAMERAQAELRNQFLRAFARGLRLEGFAPDGCGGGEYLLVTTGTKSSTH